MTCVLDSRDPIIRTEKNKIWAGSVLWENVSVSNSVVFSSSLPGQGAITAHCLQRTPDQTITRSGSPRAPTARRASDSTDKWESRATRPSRVVEWSGARHFLPSVPCHQMGCDCGCVVAPPFASCKKPSGSEEIQEEEEWKCAPFSPPLKSVWHCDHGHILDSLWSPPPPLRDTPQLHRSPHSVPQRLHQRPPQRQKQKEEKDSKTVQRWGDKPPYQTQSLFLLSSSFFPAIISNITFFFFQTVACLLLVSFFLFVFIIVGDAMIFIENIKHHQEPLLNQY